MDKKLLKFIKKDLLKLKVYNNFQEAFIKYNTADIKGKDEIAISYLLEYHYKNAIDCDNKAIAEIFELHAFVEEYLVEQDIDLTNSYYNIVGTQKILGNFTSRAKNICNRFEQIYEKDIEDFKSNQKLEVEYGKIEKCSRLETIIETHHLG